uniref:Protein DCL, chloroplastic n=1 Tax=Oryza meridionalis TaxID=40149 RepID=A0A0E0CRW9_9ORYZ
MPSGTSGARHGRRRCTAGRAQVAEAHSMGAGGGGAQGCRRRCTAGWCRRWRCMGLTAAAHGGLGAGGGGARHGRRRRLVYNKSEIASPYQPSYNIRYENGDRLSPEHEKAILERLLPYHPQYEKKIGCGIDYLTVGLHPEFENSRCLFIVRKDGEQVDFSFWKCIKGLIRQKYPMYADSFILRHFRRRQDYRISDS